jgi:hypothetical protein
LKITHHEFDWDVDEDKAELAVIESDPAKQILWRQAVTYRDVREDPKDKKWKEGQVIKVLLSVSEQE